MLTLRMRLAYLNSEAAKEVIPRVTQLMAAELFVFMVDEVKSPLRRSCPHSMHLLARGT